MASLLTTATGNFTTAGTWGLVDSTSELDSEAGSTAISTSTLDSSTFTPGTVTVDGIAIKLAARASSPSGTFTVTLRNNTSSLDVDSVTVNVSDLPASGLGWVFFKFSSSHLLLGATLYDVRVVCSATGSQVTLYRNATSNNWSRKLRTTTTQAPASGDQLVMSNELTGAGTNNAITVTLDNTATTSFGPTVSGGPPQGIVVSNGATFNCGTSASTAYYLKWKGVFLICGGGTVNFGTSGTRIPATSSLTLFMDSAVDKDSEIQCQAGGIFNCYGATKNAYARLTVDKIATNTIITVDATTGWQNSDIVAFSPSGASISQHERRTISTVDSATQVTLTAGLTNSHSGTSPQQNFLLNCTRNIKIQGASTSLRGRFKVLAAWGNIYCDSVEFVTDKLLDTTNANTVLYLAPTTNSVTIINCAFNASAAGAGNNITCLFIDGASSNNYTIDTCVFYDWQREMIRNSTTTGTNWAIQNNIALWGGAGGLPMFTMQDTGGIFNGNIGISNQSNGSLISYGEATTWNMITPANFNNNQCWQSSTGFSFGGTQDLAINNGSGGALSIQNLTTNRCINGIKIKGRFRKLIIDTWTSFGSGNSNTSQSAAILFNNSFGGNVYGFNWTLSGDTTVASYNGISIDDNNNGGRLKLFLYNCTFGVASGIRNAFANADINLVYPDQTNIQVIANKCNFASPTNFLNLTNSNQQIAGDHIDDNGSYLCAQDWGQVSGDHRTFVPQGNIKLDTVIFNSGSPSERLTPNTASYKLRSGSMKTAVTSGGNRTISVTVRKSVSGDAGGANYNGNQPRLIVRRNDAMGVSADTVLATATTSGWETLSGTIGSVSEDGVLEAYVDCDGTAGWINVDDWATS